MCIRDRPSTIGPTCASTTPWRTPRSGGKSLLIIRRAAPRRASSGRTRPSMGPTCASTIKSGGAYDQVRRAGRGSSRLEACFAGRDARARRRAAARACLLGVPSRLGEHDDAGEGRGERGEVRGRGHVGLAAAGRGAGFPVVEIAAARRAARRDEVGIASAGLASRDAAQLERERAGDLVVVEVPATPRRVRAPRRASGTRGKLAGTTAP